MEMRISKKIMAVAMTAVIAASMAVPAFAGSSQVHNIDPNSWSALAANDANVKRESVDAYWEAYWNAYVQAVGGPEMAAAIVNASQPQEVKLASNTVESRIANSQAAAAIANATVELAKEELAGNTVVVAPVLTSADAAAIANATYAATHGTN